MTHDERLEQAAQEWFESSLYCDTMSARKSFIAGAAFERKRAEVLREVVKKLEVFLNEDIAYLTPTDPVMSPDQWEHAMFLRDLCDEALEQYEGE